MSNINNIYLELFVSLFFFIILIFQQCIMYDLIEIGFYRNLKDVTLYLNKIDINAS